MKRERFDYGRMALPGSLVTPGADDHLNLARSFSLPGERCGRTRKIFVIKKTSRLRSANRADKKIRRILIFDNHPESLRLVYGRRRSPDIDLSVPQRASSSELIILSLLTVAALVGMFWPVL